MKNWIPPFFLGLFGIILAEFCGRAEILNTSLFPTPSAVILSFQQYSGEYLQSFRETFIATVCGFLLAAFLGLFFAFILSISEWIKNAFLPFAIFFQTVPIIAIAPVLVVYFGFGYPTVISSSFVVAIFPVLANGLIGLRSLDPSEVELFKLYRSSKWKLFWKLRLPRAYPAIYSGLKISAGLAVIGTVAGEFVAGGGLGALIDSARTQQKLELVFGSLFLLSVVGLFLIGCLRAFNFLINLKRPYGLILKD